MINIINNILISNDYKKVDFDFQREEAEIYLFQPLSEIRREEYFVTVQLHSQSNEEAQILREEKAEEWFETISNSGIVDQYFEKNCTMIICHEEGKISRQTILEIEEDQYNFKKNVVTYTQQEVSALQAYLIDEHIEKITNLVINNIINTRNGSSFLEFKHNHKQQKDHYSLILKVALKLPFVTYKPQEQKLTNLLISIENSLSPTQSLIYKQLMDSDFELTEDNIHQQVERIWGFAE